MTRIRVAASDPRICRCCKRRTPDSDIEEFRRESSIDGYEGIPEICQDCLACPYDWCLHEQDAAEFCRWRPHEQTIFVRSETITYTQGTPRPYPHTDCPHLWRRDVWEQGWAYCRRCGSRAKETW